MFKSASTRLALLGVLLLVQIGVIAVLYRPDTQGATAASLLPDLDPASIERIVLHYDGDRMILARAEGAGAEEGSWVLPEAGDFPVIEANVTQLISDVVGLETSRLVGSSAEGHQRYGVSERDPVRQVDLGLSSGVTETIFIGTSPNPRATHVRRAGSDNVYISRSLDTTDVRMDAGGWVNTTYVSVDPSTVTSFQLTNANGSVAMHKDASGAWRLDGLAEDETLLTDTVESFVGTVTSLRMLRPLGRVALPEWGLEDPVATITLASVPADNPAADPIPLTLSVGGRFDTDDSLAVKANASPWNVAVTGALLDPLLQADRASFVQAAPEAAQSGPELAPSTPVTTTARATDSIPLSEVTPLTSTEAVTP